MPDTATSVFPLAAVPVPASTISLQLSENSHLGVARLKTTSHQAWTAVKSLNAPGIATCLYDSGRRTRSTGKERDEINLDFFLARYYSGAQGRFTSPDSTSYSKITNPQSWNLYAYSFNNPLRYTDPDGHEVQTANCTTEEECNKVLQAIKDAVGSTAGSRLSLTPFTQKASWLGRLFGAKDTTGYRVSISGDVGSFRALGDNASRLADLVGSSQVIAAQIATIRVRAVPRELFPEGLQMSDQIR